MNSTANNLIIYNGYPLSIVVAVLVHCLVLLLMLYLQMNNNRTEVFNLIQPTVVKALFIEENPQVRNAENLERQRIERLDQQQRSQERERQQEAEREAQRQVEADAERQRQQVVERERDQAALRERQEQDLLQAERVQQDREREQQRERELQQRIEEERRQEALAQSERQRQLENSRQDAAIAEAARTEFELVQSATALVQQEVQKTWSRPPSARNGMRAVLRLEMLPTGEVTRVTIVESSNDPAFDRSAENAVYRAAPFRELRALPIKLFNENFRILSLIFQPEDLLN